MTGELKGGYAGKILRINLAEQTFSEEPLPVEMARDFIGGAGFGIKTLFDEVPPDTDPLGPENKMILSVGPFCGTTVPCASRLVVTAKSPLTGAVGVSLTGGYFPAEMKFAGYDIIIIEGKAEKPCYLWIKDGKVSFRSAEKLWGTRTFDCQQIIKDDLRDQNIRVAAIGPAGENLVPMACIINERRAAGRKGLGAVMGSKNLKAIAIRGSNEVAIADREAYKAALANMNRAMKESEVTYPLFSKHGSPLAYGATTEMGIFATKNWSATGAWDPFEKIGLPAAEARNIGHHRCYNCPVACSQMSVAGDGDYKGIMTEGPEYETIYSLGGTVGVDNFDAVIAGDRLCDELGLDTISAGVTIGWAMELFERGELTLADTGGVELNFGNDKAMMQLLNDMAYRRGFGDILADGCKKAAARLGKGSGIAMHVKGLEMPAYDIRGAKAHGLNYATSYTGADHNRGYSNHEIFGIPVPAPVDRFAVEGKGRETKENQDIAAACCDCPTMCNFILGQGPLLMMATQNTADLMKAVSGLELTPEEVQTVGERVTNLARVFNVLAGFSRADDTFPERILTEPIPEGNSKGNYIGRADLDKMLDEYYAVRGWTREGVPTAEKLKSLGLEQAAARLAQSQK